MAALALAACSGGSSGGGPGPQALPPPPPPPPPPAPTPPPVFDTPEYRRSDAAVASNVLGAWAEGASGAGVIAATIDSGIAVSSPEFAGRIHPSSRDVTGAGRGIADESGHGTSVAGVMAAARNNAGIVGIAPEATLAVYRADRPGSCGTQGGCRYGDSAIAAGIDAAIASGARVVNISLGGSDGVDRLLGDAFRRAGQAGVVLVISAGNDGGATVDSLARAALAAGDRSAVLVAGAMGAARTISDFSNRAGDAAANYLLALGERVRSFNHEGTAFLYSGTSYAAPQVSGAIALLAQAFPRLTAAQLVEILLRSADDAGAPGIDPVYGAGILNIARAFRPIGPTSLPGSGVPLSVAAGGNGQTGMALGGAEALGAALGTVPVADSYGRLFALDAQATLRRAAPGRLAGRLLVLPPGAPPPSVAAGPLALAARAPAAAAPGSPDPFRFALGARTHLGLAQAGTDPRPVGRDLLSAALVLGPIRLRLAEGPGAALPAPAGRAARTEAGLIALDGLAPLGESALRARRALSAEVRLGRLRLGAEAGRGAAEGLPARSLAPVAEERIALSAGWEDKGMALALSLTELESRGSFLGGRFAPGIGITGGRGLEAGGALMLALGALDLRAAGTFGRHRALVSGAGLLRDAGETIETAAWSLQAAAPLLGGRARAALAQPAAVTSGALRRAPLPGLAPVRVPLAPPARERAVELGWEGRAGRLGTLSLGGFLRRDAGHVEGLADGGGWIRIARPLGAPPESGGP